MNLRENSEKTESNYGENIECDGVVVADNDADNLYIKITVPTTSDGDVIEGMTIVIEMWPTDDAAEAVDGTISPASFDNESTYTWWDNGDIIEILIAARADALLLTGTDGAHLTGIEIDE